MNYTYIVRCRDGTLYTGWTNNIEKRMEAHNSGKGARYTRSRRPVKLVYYEEFRTKEEAMKREYAIKRMRRKEKEKIIVDKSKVNTYGRPDTISENPKGVQEKCKETESRPNSTGRES